jgi:hypothetical protein
MQSGPAPGTNETNVRTQVHPIHFKIMKDLFEKLSKNVRNKHWTLSLPTKRRGTYFHLPFVIGAGSVRSLAKTPASDEILTLTYEGWPRKLTPHPCLTTNPRESTFGIIIVCLQGENSYDGVHSLSNSFYLKTMARSTRHRFARDEASQRYVRSRQIAFTLPL